MNAGRRRTIFDRPEPASPYRSPGYVRPQLRRKSWHAVRKAVLARDLYACCHCGYSGPRLTVDHKVPWEMYRGGHDDPENLWTLCARCAASKGDHESPEAWYAALKRREGPHR